MKKIKNAIIGQSGGPTAVINASLAGVINKYLSLDNHGTIYGAVNGIKGLLRGDIIDLNATFSDAENIELLKQTPSAYLGSCRYRLSENSNDEFEALEKFFKEKNIGYFFYIGGNDSMDTVFKLSEKFAEGNIKTIGIPKTIDNDLCSTDHTPGYGSCAKYIAAVTREMALDAGCYDIKNVLIVEIMGRNAGWLTAASALARNEKISAPDLIYLPERPFDNEKFLYDVRKKLLNQNTVIVAVSEGIRYADNTFVASSDSSSRSDMFGHGQLGGAGKKLEYLVQKRLGIKVRSVELNIAQRCAAHISSLTDITEAFRCGEEAVNYALSGESGKMVCMKRDESDDYNIIYECSEISNIANCERVVPDDYISESGNDVTEKFIDYIAPLVVGENKITCVGGLPIHIIR